MYSESQYGNRGTLQRPKMRLRGPSSYCDQTDAMHAPGLNNFDLDGANGQNHDATSAPTQNNAYDNSVLCGFAEPIWPLNEV